MIRNVGVSQNSSLIVAANKGEQKSIVKKGDEQTSLVDRLKDQIKNGEYKVDLKAVATKMAQELKPS